MQPHNTGRNRGVQDRLNRIAQRLVQKFGNTVYSEGGNTGGVPLNVLERAAGNKVIRDSIGSENPSAISFTMNEPGLGKTYGSDEQITVDLYDQQNFPAGLCGSALPLVMLAKLKAGVDSVDFHVVADSNASDGASIANMYMGGWNGGLIKGLIRGCSAAMYATPLQPVMIHPTSHSAAGIPAAGGAGLSHAGAASGSSFRMINASLFDGATSQVWSDGATMQSGNYFAPTDLKKYFDIQNKGLRMTSVNGGYTADFAYVSSGLTFVRNNEISTGTAIYPYIPNNENNNIDTRNALTYRVVHATIPNGGSIPLHIYGLTMQNWTPGTGITTSFSNPYYVFAPVAGESSTDYAKHFKRISVSGATGITASWQTWGADSTRVGVTIGFNWYGLGSGFGGNTYAKGPFAVYLDSVHNNTKGFAINNIIYWGGALTSSLADVIDSVSTPVGTENESALRTILKETRERQIQAGGSGNVIVFLNSGINDANAAATNQTYYNNIVKLVNAYQNTWESLSYPENDLAFIITTTHPTQFPDSNLSGYRTIGKTLKSSKPNVLYADLTALGTDGITYGGLTAGNSFSGNANLYESDGTSHLNPGSSGGYAYLAELLVKRCLRYTVSY